MNRFPPLHDLSRVPVGPVLVVAPHPDDEILGCGGAIALHVRRGDRVHVALVTAGEGGGDPQRRTEESRAAANLLGRTDVTSLGARDGAVAQDAGLPERLEALVARERPVVVYAPSPFELHPDHLATLRATAVALRRGPPPRLLLYEVNTETPATFLLDITPVKQLKRKALETFGSQRGLVDLVEKCDARARARTVNVDLPAVTHAEAFLELAPAAVDDALRRVDALRKALGLPAD
ncbi:MAG TPA: PIG-L deacetylase family protein [Planctomycetota bacterium]|nr:PIG-L deacetylase family protein [Planctomycetota bacterium]